MFCALIASMTFICCTNGGDAVIRVKVEKSGHPVQDEEVFMFQRTDTVFVKNSVKAAQVQITDVNGIAEFTVNGVSIGDAGTYRIFETFGDNGLVNGRVSAYISSGNKRIPLTLKQKE